MLESCLFDFKIDTRYEQVTQRREHCENDSIERREDGDFGCRIK